MNKFKGIKRAGAVLCAAVLTLSSSFTVSAATWEGVDTWEKLLEVFAQDQDEVVTIELTGDILFDGTLTANEGQTYIINGEGFALTDAAFTGGGSVEINSAVTGTEENSALYTDGNVDVTVNTDITSDGTGVEARGNSSTEVNGSITAVNDYGVWTLNAAEVSVNGDINADFGIVSTEESKVTVDGSVAATGGQAPDEEGNLEYGNMNDPEGASEGGNGINASQSSAVTVTGNVTGGEGYGTDGGGGIGVYAAEDAAVNVGGSVTGGNVTADPSVEAEIGWGSRAGDGIAVEYSANVTIGGDIQGGSTNGSNGTAGSGAVILVPFNSTDVPGQVQVGGSLTGGTAEYGEDGAGIFYQGTIASEITADMLGESGVDLMSFIDWETSDNMAYYYSAAGLPREGYPEWVTPHRYDILEVLADVLHISQEEIINVSINEMISCYDALPAEEKETAVGRFVDLFNGFHQEIRDMAGTDFEVNTNVPVITVGAVIGGGDAQAFGADARANVAQMLGADVNYHISVLDSEHGSVSVDRTAAKIGETVTVTPTPEEGYEVSHVFANGTEITPADGVYTFVLGGRTEVAAEFAEKTEKPEVPEVPEEPEGPSTDPSQPDGSQTEDPTLPDGNGEDNVKNTSDSGKSAPGTGDSSPAVLPAVWAMLAAGAAAVGGTVLYISRKRR